MWIPGKVARAINSTIITLVLKSPASREKHETSSIEAREARLRDSPENSPCCTGINGGKKTEK